MSQVLSTGVASPVEASAFFEAQLKYRTDPADLAADLLSGEAGEDGKIVVIDTRSPAHYAEGHIPGAVSFPHRTMNPASTAALPRDKVYVCYCDGIGCNGSTQGAYKLAALGFQVKELIGGLHWWRQDGFAVATGSEAGFLQKEMLEGGIACAC
ncbi:rhodanese-like domain-containing protein [Aeromonas lusitana]|uniref:Rhodanese n=1 Tax=Aeromonas lusitana TaxID=931529 RepID=A0A2M8H4W5_9GAMM|nr:rhodanese-like domain-containing protein [Aeromonas lusitana]PJC91561.1 rhodanese [Aeromonas lusitana]